MTDLDRTGRPEPAVATAPSADPTAPTPTVRWFWSDPTDPRPANRFTWFRRVVQLDDVPESAALRFAADSTARLWVNGTVARRKVARFDERQVRLETVDVGALLRPGANVIAVLHHSWGDIVTFQRSQFEHAGVVVDADWIAGDEPWRWSIADEFAVTEQFRGAIDHTPRIRYPIDCDARVVPVGLHEPDFDDRDWLPAVTVDDGPWPDAPGMLEIPGQREVRLSPGSVLAAGTAEHDRWSGDPVDRPSLLASARVSADPAATAAAGALVSGQPYPITGEAGRTRYVTVDFQRPVHGFPTLDLELDRGTAEVRLGYGELVKSPYDGAELVTPQGWLDVDAVVATGYTDRVVIGPGRTSFELPDERTARWLTVHVTCTDHSTLTIHDCAMIGSQYPVRPIGTFACGDEQLHQIVKLGLIHAELTMTDSYVDTPGREDGAWIEDAHPRAQLAQQWYGDTRLRRFLIRTLAEGQDDAGELHPFYPSNYPARPASYDWAVQWVGLLYDEWRWSADIGFLADHAGTLIRLWDVLLSHVDEEGRWRTGRVLGDIKASRRPGADGSSGPITPMVIERLRWSAELIEVVGDQRQAADWSVMAERLADGFRRHHVMRDHPAAAAVVADRWEPGLASDERGTSQAGQTAALLGGLLTPDEADALVEFAFPAPDGTPPAGMTRWNTPPWAYRVLTALTDHGRAERAIAHLKERYAAFLPGHPRNPTPLILQGPYGGPLPEYWLSREDLALAPGEPNPAQPVDPTGTHGWGASPLVWLHDHLLGITIAVAGGSVLDIAPCAAGLPYVSGWSATPLGSVWVHLDPQQRELEVTLPAGVSARLRVPAEIGPGRQMVAPDGVTRPVSPGEVVELAAVGTWRVMATA